MTDKDPAFQSVTKRFVTIISAYTPHPDIYGRREGAVLLTLEALFAVDCVLMAHKENHPPSNPRPLRPGGTDFLAWPISLGKTEVFAPGSLTHTTKPQPSISIDGTELKCVQTFKYLGSTISSDGSLDKEITARMRKQVKPLDVSEWRYFSKRVLGWQPKLKIYKAVVLASLLNGCATWILYRRHFKQLEKFHMKSLRSIMSIRWQDKISNLEVLERAELQSIESMLIKARLRCTVHVIRMEGYRISKHLPVQRAVRRQKKNWTTKAEV